MNYMIENECVRARNYAVFRPTLDELKCDSRNSQVINIYSWPSFTKIY